MPKNMNVLVRSRWLSRSTPTTHVGPQLTRRQPTGQTLRLTPPIHAHRFGASRRARESNIGNRCARHHSHATELRALWRRSLWQMEPANGPDPDLQSRPSLLSGKVEVEKSQAGNGRRRVLHVPKTKSARSPFKFNHFPFACLFRNRARNLGTKIALGGRPKSGQNWHQSLSRRGQILEASSGSDQHRRHRHHLTGRSRGVEIRSHPRSVRASSKCHTAAPACRARPMALHMRAL